MSALEVEPIPPIATLRLFGTPVLTGLGREVIFTTERPYQLLAYLAVKGGWVRRDELADLFYPDRSLDAARSNLRKVLLLARRVDGVGAVEQSGELLRWQPDSDLQRFERACDAGRLAEAVHLYAGPLLDGLDIGWRGEAAEWLAAERRRLESRWNEVGGRRLSQLASDPEAATALARRLLRQDPFDEQALTAYSQAQAALGSHAAAIEALEDYGRRLEDAFAVGPSARLQSLAKQLRAEIGTVSSTTAAAAVRAASAAPSPPAPPGSAGLVGRRQERAQVADHLAQPDGRLLTLWGPGGVGKSALARAVLEGQSADRRRWPGGTAWVALEDLRSIDALPARIAAGFSLELPAGSDDWQALARALGRGGPCLAVLDNAETLIDPPKTGQDTPAFLQSRDLSGSEDIVPTRSLGDALSGLLVACPALKLLVTSRSALGGTAERRLPLGGLALPDADETEAEVLHYNDAVQLFVTRARALAPCFDLAREAAAVVHLVHAVDGLPLAIELLAPWRRLMPAPEILRELEASLELLDGDGLAAGAPNSADRGVRASFERSWRMLGSTEQRVLAQMALLPDPIDRALTRQVIEAPLAVLAALVERSLVRADGDGMFSLHPLLRRLAAPYAAGEAGTSALMERHARHVAQRLHRPHAAQGDLIAAVDAEIAHARAAWCWATAHADPVVLQTLAGPLALYDRNRGSWQVGLAEFGGAIAALDVASAKAIDVAAPATRVALACLLAGQADLQYAAGALDAAEASALRCMTYAEGLSDDGALAAAMMTLNGVHWQRGEYDVALRWVDRYYDCAVRSNNRLRQAHAHTARGLNLTELDRSDEALHASQAARALLHAIGETVWLPTLLNNMGNLLRLMGRPAEAVEMLLEGQHWAEHHRLVKDLPFLLVNMAIAQEDLGDVEAGLKAVERGLAEAEEHGEPYLRLYGLLTQGRLRAHRDRALLPAMKSVWQAIGVGDSLGLAWTRFDSVITAARIYARADQPARGAAILQWVLVQAGAPESCRRAASKRLDGLQFEPNAIESAAHRLPDNATIEAVLATLPGRYA